MAYKKQSVPFNIRYKNFVKKYKRYSKVFYTFFIFVILVGLGIFAMSITFFSPKNKIKNIIFNPQNYSYFDEKGLYSSIGSGLIGKNIFSAKTSSNNLVSKIQQSYPIVKNIHFSNSGTNTLVNVDFFNPTLIFSQQGSYVGVYKGYFFPLSNDSLFLSGRLVVYVPTYIDNLTGAVFYNTSEETLKYQMERLISEIPNLTGVEYLIGGGKTIAKSDGKTLIFDNENIKSDINVQLEKLQLYRSNPLQYPVYKDSKIIDLGSMDDSIIVSSGENNIFDMSKFDSVQNLSGDILSGENLNISGENNIFSGENFSTQMSSSSKMSTTDRA